MEITTINASTRYSNITHKQLNILAQHIAAHLIVYVTDNLSFASTKQKRINLFHTQFDNSGDYQQQTNMFVHSGISYMHLT
jgi:hypothetical protein